MTETVTETAEVPEAPAPPPRLKERYRAEIVPALQE